METTTTVRSNRGSIGFLRLVERFFAVVSLAFIFHGVILLCDPNAVVTINHVKQTDMAAKAEVAFFPVIILGLGLYLAFAPESELRKRRRRPGPVTPHLRFRRWQKRLY